MNRIDKAIAGFIGSILIATAGILLYLIANP